MKHHNLKSLAQTGTHGQGHHLCSVTDKKEVPQPGSKHGSWVSNSNWTEYESSLLCHDGVSITKLYIKFVIISNS